MQALHSTLSSIGDKLYIIKGKLREGESKVGVNRRTGKTRPYHNEYVNKSVDSGGLSISTDLEGGGGGGRDEGIRKVL
jgi:hypothetical protein